MRSADLRRFELPPIGPAVSVAFPTIARERLANGLAVWVIPRPVIPTVAMVLVVDGGSDRDPDDRPGLAGLTADMLDEAAGGRDTMALADAFAKLGTAPALDVGPDVTTCGCTTLARNLQPVLSLLADMIRRPHLAEADLVRVRELRQHRLRQLSATAGASADRAFLRAVFPNHPYGHGALGTTPALEAMSIDDVRRFHEALFGPARATLIIAGDVTIGTAVEAATQAFAGWSQTTTVPAPAAAPVEFAAVADAVSADPAALAAPVPLAPVVLVDRPLSPQSELRVGHRAPGRSTPVYHALVTVNAILGGQFSSRLNANLRETRGYTYGARSSFDLRRTSGTFACDTSVQADATAAAIVEILRECDGIRVDDAIGGDELARAKAALTRGYARNFETAEQIVRAAVQLATFGLPDRTFDEFVPGIAHIDAAEIVRTARQYIQPDRCAIVVVGDVQSYRRAVEALGRPVHEVVPEF